MKKKFLITLIALSTSFSIFHFMNWDDRLYYYFFTGEGSTVHLNKYELKDKVLFDKVSNLSGITYNPVTDTLFMVTNNPTDLIEINKSGKVLNSYKLEGFKDTEGLCFTPAGILVVLEERAQSISLINIPEENNIIYKANSIKNIEISVYDKDNKGFEGISYSSDQQSFYIVKEDNPPSLLKLKYDDQTFSIESVKDFQTSYLEDFSDIFCKSDGLLILSDQAALLSETSYKGELQSFLELDQGFNKLDKKIPQAEGVCLDDTQSLYIVSEPNILYIYKKSP